MPVPFRTPRLLAAGAMLALAASFLVVGGMPASAITYPPITVSKTTAHSGEDHGDMITESGAGCDSGSVTMYMASGVVADSAPIDTDLTDNEFGAVAAADGDWTGVYSVSGGGGNPVLAAGQYTLRTTCQMGETVFVYAGVVITINGDAVTTTTVAPTTTAPASPSTTAAPTTTAVPVTTATPAAAVAAQATFTG